MPTLTWSNRNRVVQADVPIDHFDADTGLEDGQETKIEWRWRADPGDAWSDPTVHTVTVPPTSTFDPPADGWVQAKVYSWREGLASWQHYIWEGEVVGGVAVNPSRYVDEDGNPYVDENADTYYDT